eukprot:jgi/Tetstr1/465693/TSEL_010334.t1
MHFHDGNSETFKKHLPPWMTKICVYYHYKSWAEDDNAILRDVATESEVKLTSFDTFRRTWKEDFPDVTTPKTVKPGMLLKYHLTCVKYDGYRLDNIYYYTNTIPHDSSTTCSLVWITIMKRKEEVDDFLREHGQTVPAEACHTMATNADLNNAEAARVEAEVRAQVLQDDIAFQGVHAGAKERLHDNTSPSDAKGTNLVVIDVSDAIHDASGSREVFNEDGTMVRKKWPLASGKYQQTAHMRLQGVVRREGDGGGGPRPRAGPG